LWVPIFGLSVDVGGRLAMCTTNPLPFRTFDVRFDLGFDLDFLCLFPKVAFEISSWPSDAVPETSTYIYKRLQFFGISLCDTPSLQAI
jgi:hypothetical protein